MKNTPINFVKDTEQQNLMRWILEKGQGIPITLSAAPTADVPLLRPYETGVYSDVYYKRFQDTILVFTPSSTISVTTDEP